MAVIGRKLFVAGGLWPSRIPAGILKSAEFFEADRWTPIADMLLPRHGFGMASHNGRIYALGGHHGMISMEVYDLNTDSWQYIVPLYDYRLNIAVAQMTKWFCVIGGVFGRHTETAFYVDPENDMSVTINRYMKHGRESPGVAVLRKAVRRRGSLETHQVRDFISYYVFAIPVYSPSRHPQFKQSETGPDNFHA